MILQCATTDIVDGVGRQRETVFVGLSFRRTLHDAEDAFDDIGDIGEVALHVAVAEDLDRAAFGERVGGREIEHVRAACETVNGEEAEAGGRSIVELSIAVSQEFVGLFSGRVEGDRRRTTRPRRCGSSWSARGRYRKSATKMKKACSVTRRWGSTTSRSSA